MVAPLHHYTLYLQLFAIYRTRKAEGQTYDFYSTNYYFYDLILRSRRDCPHRAQ